MYESFAKIYDTFMDNVPYDFWTEQIITILKSHGIDDGIICDLGCGTGSFTERLSKYGYDMIGIDRSPEMLSTAIDRMYEGMDADTEDDEISEPPILYLCQDMREFELYGTVRACISRCDSLNYITDYDELVQVFKLVNNYLDPGGLFIFDVKSEHMFRDVLGYNTFARTKDEGSYIWQNAYYPEDRINEYELTMYIRTDGGEDICEGGDDGTFIRSRELHVQRAYSIEELKKAAEEAGLEWIAATDANTDGEIDDESERFLIVLRECTK